MKKRLFLSSLLAVCVTCVAQADASYQAYCPGKGDYKIDGDLTVNYFKQDGNTPSTVTVNGTTTIDGSMDSLNADNKTIKNIVNNSDITVYGEIKDSEGNVTSKYCYSCQVGKSSTLASKSIIFNGPETLGSNEFVIQGTVKTDKFIVTSNGSPVLLNLGSANVNLCGRIESFTPGEKGTLEINENVELKVGTNGAPEKYNNEITLDTVIIGGIANIHDNVTMGDITMESGEINFYYDSNTATAGIEVGDLTVKSGTINVKGNALTGALTLDNVTVNFSADAAIDLGEESLILGDNVAITLNVDSLDDIEGVTLFKTTGKVEGFEDITVTFVDATGTTKEAAVSYSNGSVVTTAIPEPTTATLSLLALAGLAARRRRR